MIPPANEYKVTDTYSAEEAAERLRAFVARRPSYPDHAVIAHESHADMIRMGHLRALALSAQSETERTIKVAAPCSDDLWDEIIEYLEDHEDVVDGAYGESMPNKAMSILNRLRSGRG